MLRRQSLFALATLGTAAALPPWARAQSSTRLPRVVIVHSGPAANFQSRAAAFTRGMRELGYEDGRNVNLDWQSANGQEDLLREIALRLERESPDAIVSGSTITTRALHGIRRAPIVMAAAEDPVAEGFVRSMANPGGNITGLSGSVLEQLRRQMEILAEVAPRLRRITALLNPGSAIYKTYRARVEFSLPPGMRLNVVDAAAAGDIERAFNPRARDDTEGVLVMNDPLFYLERRAIAEQAIPSRRPVMYPLRGYVEVGGLVSWGPNPEANFLRAAWYVDRVLKGTKPADLPVEPPARFELVANRDAARALGITLPPELLKQARVLGA